MRWCFPPDKCRGYPHIEHRAGEDAQPGVGPHRAFPVEAEGNETGGGEKAGPAQTLDPVGRTVEAQRHRGHGNGEQAEAGCPPAKGGQAAIDAIGDQQRGRQQQRRHRTGKRKHVDLGQGVHSFRAGQHRGRALTQALAPTHLTDHAGS